MGTAAVVGGAVARRGQPQPAEPAPAPEPVATAAPAAGPSPDAIEQLTQLGALREKGILTEEEFAAQKAKILGA